MSGKAPIGGSLAIEVALKAEAANSLKALGHRLDVQLESAQLTVAMHEVFFDALALAALDGGQQGLVDLRACKARVELHWRVPQQLLARKVRLLDARAIHVHVAQVTTHDRVAFAHGVERAL